MVTLQKHHVGFGMVILSAVYFYITTILKFASNPISIIAFIIFIVGIFVMVKK